jgi:hypothetical protein
MTAQMPNSEAALYSQFFEHGEVRSQFTKEYISLWPGWLGKEQLHLLDKVSEEEWLRFNQMLLAIFQSFRMGVVNHASETIEFHADLDPFLSDHQTSMQKDASQFSQYVIPALDCVLTEEWDYTYILWHQNEEALEAIKPLVLEANLKHFSN